MQKSSTTEERLKLVKAQKEADESKHNFKMEELVFARETDRLRNEQILTQQRIKSAEIRKAQDRRENARYANSYAKE